MVEFEAEFSVIGDFDDESRALVNSFKTILVKYISINDFELNTTDMGFKVKIEGKIPMTSDSTYDSAYFIVLKQSEIIEGATLVQIRTGEAFAKMNREMNGVNSFLAPDAFHPTRFRFRGDDDMEVFAPAVQVDGLNYLMWRGKARDRLSLMFSGGAYDQTGAGFFFRSAPARVTPPVATPAVGAYSASPAPGTRFRDCSTCPEMVWLPTGEFTMGSPASEAGRGADEGPQRRVRIGYPLAVGVHEVTRGEFGRFVSSTGHAVGGSCWTFEDGKYEERPGRSWRSPGFSQGDDHPVVCVNWDDAQAYVRWLSRETGKGYRLPSEAEWEYAARGGTSTSRWWGHSADSGCGSANGADLTAKDRFSHWTVASCRDGHVYTAPVGSYGANPFGLYDVLGNVFEWVGDCWNGSYAGAPSDGGTWTSGECGRRVVRGGSWGSSPRYVRAAYRSRSVTGGRNNRLGFRVARTY